MEAKEIGNEVLVERADANDNKTPVSLGKPAEELTKESKEGAIRVEAQEIGDKLPANGANTKEDDKGASNGDGPPRRRQTS